MGEVLVPAPTYPCLECGRRAASPDRYVVCDDCLAELEAWFRAELRFEALEAQHWEGSPVAPLTRTDADMLVRQLLDSW